MSAHIPSRQQVSSLQADLHFEEPSSICGTVSKQFSAGYAILTSHQLIWVESLASGQPSRSCTIPLAAVQEASLRSTLLWAPPKLCLRVQTDAAGHPVQGGGHAEEVRWMSQAAHAHCATKLKRSRSCEVNAGQHDQQAAADAAA